MFKRWLQDWQTESPIHLERAVGSAVHLGLLGTGALGVLLGLALLFTRPVSVPWPAVLALWVIGWLLGGLCLWLAERVLKQRAQSKRTALLAAALQAGSAPAIPWLFGCSLITQPLYALPFLVQAALLYLWIRRRVKHWVLLCDEVA